MDLCVEGDETISRGHHCEVVSSPHNRILSLVPGTGRNLVYLNGEDVLTATPLKLYNEN